MEWTICAWCGRDFERREALATIQSIPSKRPGQVEPTVTEVPALPGPAQQSLRAAGVERSGARRPRQGTRMSTPAPDPLADG
jgi:hypothetical protein